MPRTTQRLSSKNEHSFLLFGISNQNKKTFFSFLLFSSRHSIEVPRRAAPFLFVQKSNESQKASIRSIGTAKDFDRISRRAFVSPLSSANRRDLRRTNERTDLFLRRKTTNFSFTKRQTELVFLDLNFPLHRRRPRDLSTGFERILRK